MWDINSIKNIIPVKTPTNPHFLMESEDKQTLKRCKPIHGRLTSASMPRTFSLLLTISPANSVKRTFWGALSSRKHNNIIPTSKMQTRTLNRQSFVAIATKAKKTQHKFIFKNSTLIKNSVKQANFIQFSKINVSI